MKDHRARFMHLSAEMFGPPLRALFNDRAPKWFGYALAEVECVAPGADVLYAGTEVAEGSTTESYSARITVLTDTLLVVVEGGSEEGAEWHRTTARGRGGLTSLTVSAGVSAFSEWPQSPPGPVDVELTYGDGLTLTLSRVGAAEVLESLRGDLEASL